MPIYEYRCGNCGNEFELMRPMSQMSDPAKCTRCGGSGQRLVSAFANSNLGVGIMIPKTVFRGQEAAPPANAAKASAPNKPAKASAPGAAAPKAKAAPRKKAKA